MPSRRQRSKKSRQHGYKSVVELVKIHYELKIVNAWTERGFGKKK